MRILAIWGWHDAWLWSPPLRMLLLCLFEIRERLFQVPQLLCLIVNPGLLVSPC